MIPLSNMLQLALAVVVLIASIIVSAVSMTHLHRLRKIRKLGPDERVPARMLTMHMRMLVDHYNTTREALISRGSPVVALALTHRDELALREAITGEHGRRAQMWALAVNDLYPTWPWRHTSPPTAIGTDLVTQEPIYRTRRPGSAAPPEHPNCRSQVIPSAIANASPPVSDPGQGATDTPPRTGTHRRGRNRAVR